MADDIVTRLKNGPNGTGWSCDFTDEMDVIHAAATEIERLRAERDEWQAEYHKAFSELGLATDEIERLRATGDQLAKHLDAHYGMHNPAPSEIVAALSVWKEARHD